jgi:hypothetical protein
MRTLIHFSAFNSENSIILKELAIVHLDFDSSQSWIFKPPFPISQLSKTSLYATSYLSENVFGLEWMDGDVDYQEFKNIIINYTHRSSTIFTHGRTRQEFLQDILEKTVINLEELHCPKFSSLSFPSKSCAHPSHQYSSFRCSLKEAQCYSSFIKYLDLSFYVLPQDKCVYKPTPIVNNVD